MPKKLIGILILLSFLIVRNSNLLAVDAGQQPIALEQCNGEQLVVNVSESSDGDTGGFPDEEKEPKQTEFADEECLPVELIFSRDSGRSSKLLSHTLKRHLEVYFTLPYPPPELYS